MSKVEELFMLGCNHLNNFLRRSFDLSFALIMLVIFFIPILLIALLIQVNLGSPVLFRQQRPGLNGKLFIFYKFRTMREAYDVSGDLLPDSKRVTRLGTFLRRFSLDELPQLFNVIKGEMSIIGPRPLLVEYLKFYDTNQFRRHEVKPGITGWAQINGRNTIAWDDKFKLDVWYVDNQTIWLDVKILWLTFFKVLRREGISQAGHVTMEKFKGN